MPPQIWPLIRVFFKSRDFHTFESTSLTIIIIIILRLRSSRQQVSSIDGGLEPSPTADCHLADYQDPPEDNEYNW